MKNNLVNGQICFCRVVTLFMMPVVHNRHTRPGNHGALRPRQIAAIKKPGSQKTRRDDTAARIITSHKMYCKGA
ncbi:hypothetical protein [Komagataeibacter xylinus]|uniref:hypothetical protein n=1 Tax=Komagataeibacter xylinus TaxID=28448 RepID=UPI001013D2DF|nr:hypothetical protein [Komagataeibacter xylinus]